MPFGGGAAITALAIAFTALSYSIWQLALCWFFGVMLLIAGLFWDSMTSVAYPGNLRALEENLLSLLRADWDGKGKVLDVGTGSGRLAVPIAREFPEANVTGVDIWMKAWGHSGLTKARAEKNAAIANVADRCVFQYGSALELPFEDGEFSLVVSAFVFHEISVPDRTVLIAEALQVLAPQNLCLIQQRKQYPYFGLDQSVVRRIRQRRRQDRLSGFSPCRGHSKSACVR